MNCSLWCGRNQQNAIEKKEETTIVEVKDPPAEVTISVYFWPMSWLYCGVFFSTLFVSLIVTMFFTSYSPETDKIQLFYGVLNPCILFDHYPAKVFATVGMGMFILIGNAYAAVLFIYIYCEKKLLSVIWAAAIIGVVGLMDVLFVNVFTTNLYPLEEQLLADVIIANATRRLHGVHYGEDGGTISLAEMAELTQTDINIIKLHTMFYISWLLGQFLFFMYLISREFPTWQQFKNDCARSLGRQIILSITFCVGSVGMCLHAAAMIIIVLHPDPKKKWYPKDWNTPDAFDTTTQIQAMVLYVDGMIYSSSWGWAPVMFFRLVMPKGSGIRLRFRLEDSEDDDGKLMPEAWLSYCMYGIACVFAWAGIFDPKWTDNMPSSQLLFSLRDKPFAYFGAPAYLVCVILLSLGLFLQVIQKRLMSQVDKKEKQGKWSWPLLGHAVVLWFAFFLLLLIILDRADWVLWVGSILQVAFLTWVLHMTKEPGPGVGICGRFWNLIMALVYCGIGVIILALCHVPKVMIHGHDYKWCLYYVYLIWLACYRFAVPDGKHIRISARQIKPDSREYEPVAGAPGNGA